MLIKWLLLVCVMVFLGGFGSAQTVRMAVFQLEPFMMEVSPKKAGGVTVEYWERFLAPKMGVNLEVVGPYPIPRVMKMLENGEVDVVSQLSKTAERDAIFLYPETHLTLIKYCVIVRANDPLNAIKSPADFYGKKIGFSEDTYLPPFMIDERIKIELVSNADYRRINLNKLFAGRIDGILDLNYDSFCYYLKINGLYEKVKPLLLPLEPGKVYSLFRRTPEGKALSEAFDRANREGLAAGVFESITREYLQ
ncbi:MAG: transporter substrate-binding domain-containing protein [Spirochaetales bacterium]|nr:transporter substrate-binding domain-containing protein [Spirochaetales bacterium]